MVIITQLTALPPDIIFLEREASGQGFPFVGRLIDEWRTGANRFQKEGERLVMATHGDCVVGIGGLNVDPHQPTGDTARLRRLYVCHAFRRQGIGEALVHALLEEASTQFRTVRLTTDTPAGAAFYERLGFTKVAAETATHVKTLR
jgi:GNAT superfamily N-acetyltransferase